MITGIPYNEQLDDLLERICEKLQITPTQQVLAEQRYQSVGEWLSAEGSVLAPVDPHIYPQGSLRTGTTVKPLSEQEYDLDLVCELNITWEKYDPVHILNVIENRLKENGKYAPLLERKNRCIRINYANEFHMDVLPACPDCLKNHGCVKVPDRKASEWKDSNPKGYAEWFENRSRILHEILAKAMEPLPKPEPAHRKPPLKRAIQLMKRYRDIAYEGNPEMAPISIILTTLAGMHYNGQNSVNDALSSILSDIVFSIPSTSRLIVLNPTNPDEDFSEKWEEERGLYKSFLSWTYQFRTLWEEVNDTKGIHNIAKILSEMFGENITSIVIKKQAEFLEKSRQAGTLKTQNENRYLIDRDNSDRDCRQEEHFSWGIDVFGRNHSLSGIRFSPWSGISLISKSRGKGVLPPGSERCSRVRQARPTRSRFNIPCRISRWSG